LSRSLKLRGTFPFIPLPGSEDDVEDAAKTARSIGQRQKKGRVMQADPIDSLARALRQMTAEQLLYLGSRQVVYLKPGMDGFMIYGADGTPLEMVDAIEAAVEMVAQNGLRFVAVH
jgi:hypothetical protein